MFDSSFSKATITDFRGAWTAREHTDVPNSRATLAQNVQFQEGRVLTRYGYASVFSASAIVRAMLNWLYADPSAGQKNYLLIWNDTSDKLQWLDLSNTSLIYDAYTQSGAYAATFANCGSRIYVSQFGTDMLGKGHGRSVQIVAGFPAADNLFARPMLTTEVTVSASFASGGNCTPGQHRFAFILERRSGAILRPGPANTSLELVPATATATSANRTGTITLTPATTWPADAYQARLLATTTVQPSRWLFVPGGVAGVVGGSSFVVSIPFNIGDGDLAKNGDEATSHFALLTQDSSGTAPFNPAVVFEYGDRIGYVFSHASYGQGVFFSDPGNYQALNAAYSVYYLPGQRQVVTGFSLGGVCYMIGPSWTYSTEDTGGRPSEWPGAILIDGAIGTLSPRGATVNAALGYAWVAGSAGLFRFSGGHYDSLPVSWRCSNDWARINWAAAYAVQVVDDAARKRVRVLAPIDGATGPNAMMVFDYTNGTGPGDVNYSLETIGGSASFACGAVVQNDTSKLQEFWLGPGNAAQSIRKERSGLDATPFRDDTSTAIASAYRTGPVIGPRRPRLSHHHGITVRIRGSGSVTPTAYSLDAAASSAASAITLTASPGVEHDRLCDLIAEDCMWHFANENAADAYFDLSLLTHYSTGYTTQR